MEGESWYIYEITEDGTLKKASLSKFNSREEAEKNIKNMLHPAHPQKLFAIKVFISYSLFNLNLF